MEAIFCLPALGRSAARKILIFPLKPQSSNSFAVGKLCAPWIQGELSLGSVSVGLFAGSKTAFHTQHPPSLLTTGLSLEGEDFGREDAANEEEGA